MAEPINHVINPKQLFFDLKSRFPEVPDQRILDIIHQHGSHHDLCMEALNEETANYVPRHLNDMIASNTEQQFANLRVSQPTEDPAVYTNGTSAASLHPSSSTSRLRPQHSQESPLRSVKSQPQFGLGDGLERNPRLASPHHPHGSPMGSPAPQRNLFNVVPPTTRYPVMGGHWDFPANPSEYYGAGTPGRSTPSQSPPSGGNSRPQYPAYNLPLQPWAFPVRPPYGANVNIPHGQADLPSRPNQFPGGFPPSVNSGVKGSPQRPSALSQSSQEGMVPSTNSPSYGYKPVPGVGSPSSPHRGVPYTGPTSIPDPNGAFYTPATSHTHGFETYGPPSANQPISYDPNLGGYVPYPPQTISSQLYGNTSAASSNHGTPTHHGLPTRTGVQPILGEAPVHMMRPLPGMVPGSGPSAQAGEDPAYTQALIKHQIARRDKLLQDLQESNRILSSLRTDVQRLEQCLMDRRRNSGSRGNDSNTLLLAARQKNQRLLMNIQLANTEIDMYHNSTEDFHRTIPNNPGPGGDNRRSVNSTTTTTAPSTVPTNSPPRVPPPRPPPPQPSPQPQPPQYGEDEVGEPVESQWACSRCTFLNFSGLNKCEICEMPKLIPVFTPSSLGNMRTNFHS